MPQRQHEFNEDFRDVIQEITNVAVGVSADKVARSFSTFVKLPVPKVHLIEAADISMALGAVSGSERVTAVTQSFFCSGISGEALLLFTDASLSELSALMGYQGETLMHQPSELVLEMASLLNGACLHGIFSQLDISVLLKHPRLLGREALVAEMFSGNYFPWQKTLAIELNYGFEDFQLSCDLVILIHEQSLDELFEKLSYLIDD